MSYQTAEDILKKWELTTEQKAEGREVEEIKKAIATARAAIHEAKVRYVKQRLRSRSRKKAEEDPYEGLKDYESRQQIHDDYGWGFITEARMDRLFELWDAREESRRRGAAGGTFEDYVTRMLDTAWAAVGEEYAERIEVYDRQMRQREERADQIAKENNERTRRREAGEII